MFTGIIKEIGKVRGIRRSGGLARLEITAPGTSKSAGIGDSVAVNGVCLTMVANKGGTMSFDVMEETISRSGLSALKAGDAVNIEGALRAGDALGGHFVTGHIDCIGEIRSVSKKGESTALTISFAPEFGNLVVEKGSITIDGISLTIGRSGVDSVTLFIIPHTLSSTTLGSKKSGDRVNIEFDILGKYASKSAPSGKLTEQFLRDKGFA